MRRTVYAAAVEIRTPDRDYLYARWEECSFEPIPAADLLSRWEKDGRFVTFRRTRTEGIPVVVRWCRPGMDATTALRCARLGLDGMSIVEAVVTAPESAPREDGSEDNVDVVGSPVILSISPPLLPIEEMPGVQRMRITDDDAQFSLAELAARRLEPGEVRDASLRIAPSSSPDPAPDLSAAIARAIRAVASGSYAGVPQPVPAAIPGWVRVGKAFYRTEGPLAYPPLLAGRASPAPQIEASISDVPEDRPTPRRSGKVRRREETLTLF